MRMNSNSLQNLKLATKKMQCQYCTAEVSLNNLNRHENACKSNAANMKCCPVCNKMHSKKGITCSYSCSNTHFKHLRNKPEKYKNYRTICFANHQKKCIVCDETRIVEVHHLNENKKDNSPNNLIPVCPTHHQYIHSRYRNLFLPHIESYLLKRSNRE
jgi:DNA repair exonuclease SbcCD ATPase subunit